MIGIDVKVSGVEVAIKRLTFDARKRALVREEVNHQLEKIFDTSQEYVPRVTGNLAASGKIERAKGSQNIEGRVTYGGSARGGMPFPAPERLRGGAVAYALVIHEGPSSRPFYLRDAYLAHVAEVAPGFGRAVRLGFTRI